MKRIATTAFAGLIAIGSLSTGVASAQSYRGNDRSHDRQAQRWEHNRHDYRSSQRSWRRGDRLPSNYRSHYREVDWRRHHLRQPPRGYHYVRDDNTGEYLLVGIATGVILSILLSQ